MLIPLPRAKKSIWKFVRRCGNGTVTVAFDVKTLIDYMLKSGDFTDPESRCPFSEDDLSEIDMIAKKCGLNKPSVLEAFRNPSAYDEVKFKRDALESLERCAGEVIASILNTIEGLDPDEAQMRLFMVELPQFTDYFHQLREADQEYSNQCLSTWRQFLKGPNPSKPNDDPNGLIECVLDYLNIVISAQSRGSCTEIGNGDEYALVNPSVLDSSEEDD